MDQGIIFLVEEAPEGGYTARALGHSIFTEVEDLEKIMSNVQDAVRCRFKDKDMPRDYNINYHLVWIPKCQRRVLTSSGCIPRCLPEYQRDS